MDDIIRCSYEGCDREAWEYDDSEEAKERGEQPVCIFHSGKDNKEQEFEIEWVKYLQKHRDNDGNIKDLFCKVFVFPLPIDFRKSTFNGETLFSDSKFKCWSNFTGAIFIEQCIFTGVYFCKEADFSKAHFNIESNNIISFDKSLFFGEAIFTSANFSSKTDFNEVKFFKKASFDKSTFSGDLNFIRAEFTDEVNFILTHFKKVVSFEKTRFPKKASFRYAQFYKYCSFRDAIFFGTNLNYGSFANCTFADVKYNIKSKIFKKKPWMKFWRWGKIPRTDFTAIETSSIRLSSNRQLIRDIEDQQFLDQFKQYHPIVYFLWLLSCDCGRSFWLFFLWCIFISNIFGNIYLYFADVWFSEVYKWEWITPFYYSLVSFSTLGFGDIHPKVGCFWGELTVMIEVFMGYLGLGGLISIFANKLARRA